MARAACRLPPAESYPLKNLWLRSLPWILREGPATQGCHPTLPLLPLLPRLPVAGPSADARIAPCRWLHAARQRSPALAVADAP